MTAPPPTWLDVAPSGAEATAIRTGETVLSNAELRMEIDALGRSTTHRPRHRVAVVEHPSPATTLLRVLAVNQQHAIPAVLPAGLPARERTELLERIEGTAPDDRERLILMTSGTTDVPKPVALPGASMQLNAAAIAARLRLEPHDTLMCAIPLSHSYGLVAVSLTALFVGADLIMPDRLAAPPIVFRAAREQGATVLQGSASWFRLLLEYWDRVPLDAVRFVTLGSEPVEVALVERLLEVFPRAEMDVIYGMTECGPRISHLDAGDPRSGEGCVGQPFDHWEVETSGSEPETLVVKGDALMLGYIDRKGGYEGLEPDGSLVSRDIATMDDRGDIYLSGRVDRVFNVGGRLVNPWIVERALRTVAGVSAARVMPEPHPILGNVPVAEITTTDPSVAPIDVSSACRDLLDSAQRPRTVMIVAALAPPKGRSARF